LTSAFHVLGATTDRVPVESYRPTCDTALSSAHVRFIVQRLVQQIEQ